MRFCLDVVIAASVLGTLAAAGLKAGEPREVWVVKVDTRTGKLVRSLVVSPSARPATLDVRGLIDQALGAFAPSHRP